MKRLKKILKWTGIVAVALVAIALIANALFVWITQARVERQIAAIRAAGDPVTIADLARPPIPPEKNAATYLDRARADMQAAEKEIGTVHPAPECQGYLLSAGDQKAIEAAFAAYPNVMPLLEHAAACPDYDEGLDYTLPAGSFMGQPPISENLLPVRILDYRIDLLIAEGKHDEATRTAVLALRLAQLYDRTPTFAGYLVAIAARDTAIARANAALQTGRVSEDVRNALDAELALHERMGGYKWALKGDRAYMISFIGEVPWHWFYGHWFLGRGMSNIWMSEYLKLFDESISTADDTTSFLRRPLEFQLSGSWQDISQIRSSFNGLDLGVRQIRAQIRCLRVLNALQTHATVAGEKIPKLSSLGLPTETTTDPFNGQPLHVKKTPQGWLVYSVGRNLADDGGKVGDPNNGDVGVGPPMTPAAK